MAEKKEYVKLWVSYRTYFEPYTPEQIGNIVLAMLDYKEYGEEPEFEGEERFVWPAIRRDLDTDKESQWKKSEANRVNGKGGGRPKKANAYEETEESPLGFEETQGNPKNPVVFEESEKSHRKGKGKGKGQGEGQSNARARASDAEFEAFWAEYPRKVGKAAARRAFEKVKVPLETLLDAVKNQKCSDQWTRDDGRFIPHPATWLNNERWEDVLAPAKAPTAYLPGQQCRQDASDAELPGFDTWTPPGGAGDE